ncbi:MAG: hypothetical protein IJU50_00665, partial [Lachnospiraceae bacterium]|nr:hypothetical protein [Lachnospiraceae bacterium]
HLVLTDTVMAEGISLSLFYLYMIPAFRILLDESEGEAAYSFFLKQIILANLMALLACQFRGQMMYLFILTPIAMVIRIMSKEMLNNRHFPKKPKAASENIFGFLKNMFSPWRPVCVAMALMVVSFLANSIIGHSYQFAVNGIYTGKALGPANMACNILYVSEREAGEIIEDEERRQLFYRMYDQMEENQWLYDYAPKDMIGREAYYSACHDLINYEVYELSIQHYLQDGGEDASNYALYRVRSDEIGAVLFKELLPVCFKSWLDNYLAVCAVGFIRTVAVVNPVLNWYTILIYGLAAVLIMLAVIRAKRLTPFSSTMLFVLISIIGCVCSTGLVIECWARYVFYNMPFFYLAFILLTKEIKPFSQI